MIKTEIKNNIANIILSKPEVHNAFDEKMVSEITKTFIEIEKNNDVRAVILSSSGKTFCAGGDLNWMKSMINYSFEENLNDAKKLNEMFLAIDTCPVPVIGRIQGSAFGGGLGLISVCDMCVAHEAGIFSLSEVKLGLLPGVISPYVSRKIGYENARRYFLTAEKFSATDAKKMGLISEVVSLENGLDETIFKWVNSIKQNGPHAVKQCKKMLREISTLPTDKAVSITTKYISECRVSEEGQEGMKAFFEKRNPAWSK